MNFDQYEDPRPEQVELARAVTILLSVMIDKDGKPRDLADRAGREALIRAISGIPREIPANLAESDKKALKRLVDECQETRKMMKSWFWWVAGLMLLASSMISLCTVMLLK